jgi:hypothetical protein
MSQQKKVCPVCSKVAVLGRHFYAKKDFEHIEYVKRQKERVRESFLNKQTADKLIEERNFFFTRDWVYRVYREFFSEEQIEKRSKENLLKSWTKERREEHSEIMSSRDQECFDRISKSVEEWYKDEENHEKFCTRMKEVMGTDEARERNRVAQIECKNCPEARQRSSEKQKERFSKQEERDKVSERRKTFHQENPDFQKEVNNTNEYRRTMSVAQKKSYEEHPERRDKISRGSLKSYS